MCVNGKVSKEYMYKPHILMSEPNAYKRGVELHRRCYYISLYFYVVQQLRHSVLQLRKNLFLEKAGGQILFVGSLLSCANL